MLRVMHMGVTRLHEPAVDVVLGPCPGCQLWQIDYSYRVAQEFIQMVDGSFDVRPFHQAVEELLREHLDECPHLQLLVDNALV